MWWYKMSTVIIQGQQPERSVGQGKFCSCLFRKSKLTEWAGRGERTAFVGWLRHGAFQALSHELFYFYINWWKKSHPLSWKKLELRVSILDKRQNQEPYKMFLIENRILILILLALHCGNWASWAVSGPFEKWLSCEAPSTFSTPISLTTEMIN